MSHRLALENRKHKKFPGQTNHTSRGLLNEAITKIDRNNVDFPYCLKQKITKETFIDKRKSNNSYST